MFRVQGLVGLPRYEKVLFFKSNVIQFICSSVRHTTFPVLTGYFSGKERPPKRIKVFMGVSCFGSVSYLLTDQSGNWFAGNWIAYRLVR